MNPEKIRVIAMDLDGTLTQHKQPLEAAHKKALNRLADRYKLVMVGAGQVGRIFNQMEGFPIDIIGNYGMQYGKYNPQTGKMDLLRDLRVEGKARAEIEKNVARLREEFGYTEYQGDAVEYHPSGCLTFPILGTKAPSGDKLAFDPDRAKRRKIYGTVAAAFPDYCVFIGGSSSFDMAPKPWDKYHALDLYCRENGFTHDQVVFIGDDYGLGGNDESVYRSDFAFITVDDYRQFPEKTAIFHGIGSVLQ